MGSKIVSFFCFTCIFLFPSAVYATEYYVSSSGSDNNPGDLTRPHRTLSKAIDLARAGDTVYVRSGTYSEQVALSRSGTPQSPITLTAYNNETPVIDGNNVNLIYDALVQVRDNVNYVTVRGLTIQNSRNMGLANRGSHNVFENNTILYSYDTAIWHRIGTHNIFKNNHVAYNVLRNASSHSTTGITCLNTATWWPAALNSHKSHITASLWENNYVHDNCGEGIVANSGDQIIGNTFKDNWSANIYVDEASNTLVDRNLVYDTATAFIPRGNDGNYRNISVGIAIADEAECLAHDNTIQNNIIFNTRFGFSYYRYQSCSGLINVKFINNTIVNTWESSLRLLAGNHQNNLFANNIIHAKQGILLLAENTSGLTFHHNLWYNQTSNQDNQFTWGQSNYSFTPWSTLSPNVRNNQWGDPEFAGNIQSFRADAVHLNSASRAIDAGTTIGLVSDYFQKPRPQGNGIDLGAIESTPSSPPHQPGDLNADGAVNIFDYNLLVSNFGNPYTIFDYNTLVANYGK